MKNWVFIAFGAALFCGVSVESLLACDSSDPAHPVTEGQPEGGPIGAAVDSGSSSDGATATEASGPATFTEIYTTIIKPSCPSCHSGGSTTASGHLDMGDQATAYANLVGVKAAGPACGTSGETRVVPGSSANSLIYQKLTMTTPPCGSQMPLGRTPLPQSSTDEIASWINAGAIDDTKSSGSDAGKDASDDAGDLDGGTD